MFDFQNVISKSHFIIDLLALVLRNSLMSFDGEYFQEDFGIIMGTCEAAILASKYMAMLNNEFRKKCVSDPNLK